MNNHPSKPTITATASMVIEGHLTAGELLAFAREIPKEAKVTVSVSTGDPRDPREASYRRTTLTATWDSTASVTVTRGEGQRP